MKKNAILAIVFLLFILNSCKKDAAIQDTAPSNPNINYSGAVDIPNATFNRFDLPSGGPLNLPNAVDLSSLMPPIRNQGLQGSCVAFSLASLKSFHEKLEYGYSYSDNTKIMSPAFIYNQVKVGDCLRGSHTITALNFLQTNGTCTEADFPYNQDNCSIIPNSILKQNAIKNKIRDWLGFNFQKSASEVLTEMKYALSQKQPIIIDYKVDADFVKETPIGTWKENNSGDPFNSNGIREVAYHCSLIVGYDESKNAFKIFNSWGTQWKDRGYCWVDYSWFLKRVRYAFITWDEFANIPPPANAIIRISGSCPAEVRTGTSNNFNMTIRNEGTTELVVYSINATPSPPFSIVSNISFPLRINPGGSFNVELNFSPQISQIYYGIFNVSSNANSGNSASQLVGSAVNNSGISTGSWTDSRDGKIYRTVTVNGKTWLADNLNYETSNSYSGGIYGGRLYYYEDGVNACPNGWHIATDQEWIDLESYWGVIDPWLFGTRGNSTIVNKFINGGATQMNISFAGYRYSFNPNVTVRAGEVGFYWTSTNYGTTDKYVRFFSFNGIERTAIGPHTPHTMYFSIRCVKN